MFAMGTGYISNVTGTPVQRVVLAAGNQAPYVEHMDNDGAFVTDNTNAAFGVLQWARMNYVTLPTGVTQLYTTGGSTSQTPSSSVWTTDDTQLGVWTQVTVVTPFAVRLQHGMASFVGSASNTTAGWNAELVVFGGTTVANVGSISDCWGSIDSSVNVSAPRATAKSMVKRCIGRKADVQRRV